MVGAVNVRQSGHEQGKCPINEASPCAPCIWHGRREWARMPPQGGRESGGHMSCALVLEH